MVLRMLSLCYEMIQSFCENFFGCFIRFLQWLRENVHVGTLSQVKSSWSTSLSSAESLAEATKFLTAADPKLGSIITSHGQGPKFEKCDNCFMALVRSIVYQQLAGKAAATIHGRLVALCGVSMSLQSPQMFLPPQRLHISHPMATSQGFRVIVHLHRASTPTVTQISYNDLPSGSLQGVT
jgi:3-methyladenine DNA glycosylase/8-oxoguanine DNA glycosylase